MLMSAQFIWRDLGHSSARRGLPPEISEIEIICTFEHLHEGRKCKQLYNVMEK